MNINRENYEIWAIDYLEGKLSTSESAEFMLFLAENNDLSLELDLVREFNIPPIHQESKKNFSALRKQFSDATLCPENFEEFCIAYYEQDLNSDQMKELLAYVSTSVKNQYIFDTYAKTHVQADLSTKYKFKINLKKSPHYTITSKQKKIYASLAIAASLLLLFTFSILLRNNSTPQEMISSEINIEEEVIPQKLYTEPTVSSPANKEIIASNVKVSTTHPLLTRTIQVTKAQAIEVLDTNGVPDVFIPSSQLRLSAIPNNVEENFIVLNQPLYSLHSTADKTGKRILESVEMSSYNTFASLKDVNLDMLLRKSIDGINQVAETDLQYNSETDEEGRLLAFALSSDRFNIRKKFRN